MFSLLRMLFNTWVSPAFGKFVLPTAASVVSSGLAGYPTVYYDRKAVDTLESNLFFYDATDKKPMSDRSGVAMQIFGYTAFAANTTPVTEGTPGSGQALTQVTTTINLSNYADYITISNKVSMTALSNVLEEGAELLGYRGAITVDTVTNTVVDTEANGDSTTLINVAHGSYMTAAIARQARASIQAVNGLPKSNGNMYGIIHSLNAFDLTNDSSAAGSNDLQKYADSLAAKNPGLVGFKPRLGVIGGVDWYVSNNVASQTHWQSSSSTAYFAYVFGKDAVFSSSLGNTQLDQRNFSVQTRTYSAGDNSLDPATLIKASAAYNFFYGCATRPGTVNTFRRIGVESSIS